MVDVLFFWRKELSADVRVLDTGSRRICAVRCTLDSFQLLVINAYMPYEDGDHNTENFLSELTIVENIMEQNLDCLVVCVVILMWIFQEIGSTQKFTTFANVCHSIRLLSIPLVLWTIHII